MVSVSEQVSQKIHERLKDMGLTALSSEKKASLRNYVLKMSTLSTQIVLQSLGGMEFALMGDQPRASILRLAIQELSLFKLQE